MNGKNRRKKEALKSLTARERMDKMPYDVLIRTVSMDGENISYLAERYIREHKKTG